MLRHSSALAVLTATTLLSTSSVKADLGGFFSHLGEEIRDDAVAFKNNAAKFGSTVGQDAVAFKNTVGQWGQDEYNKWKDLDKDKKWAANELDAFDEWAQGSRHVPLGEQG